jgi:hypothetical protein
MVGCQAADTISTAVALSDGATEANPIVAAIYKTAGIAGIVVFKAAVIYILYNLPRDKPELQAAHAAVNVVTCAAAVNNINVISKIQ